MSWDHSTAKNPWEFDLQAVPLSQRVRRLLRLQQLHTVRALSDAIHSGAMEVFPVWIQNEVQHVFDVLKPALNTFNDRLRIARNEQRARLDRVDWNATVIGRALEREQSTALAGIDVRLLDCPWTVKTPPMELGAADALDAAVLEPRLLLRAKGCGPVRLQRLRAALEEALEGRVLSDWPQPPSNQNPKYTMARRTLSAAEMAVLEHRLARDLKTSHRATRVLATADLHTCLDLAAALELELIRIPNCGRGTLKELRAIVRDQLDLVRADPDVTEIGGA